MNTVSNYSFNCYACLPLTIEKIYEGNNMLVLTEGGKLNEVNFSYVSLCFFLYRQQAGDIYASVL